MGKGASPHAELVPAWGMARVGTARRRAFSHPTVQSPPNPDTHSMVWLRISRSSGVCECRRLEIGLTPDRIAPYCLPSSSNVIGGALKPLPTLIFHGGSMEVSS